MFSSPLPLPSLPPSLSPSLNVYSLYSGHYGNARGLTTCHHGSNTRGQSSKYKVQISHITLKYPTLLYIQLISTQSPRMIMGEAYKELEEEHKHTMKKLREVQVEREQLLQITHDITAQLRAAQHEGGELGAELEKMKEELSLAKSSAGYVKSVCVTFHL